MVDVTGLTKVAPMFTEALTGVENVKTGDGVALTVIDIVAVAEA